MVTAADTGTAANRWSLRSSLVPLSVSSLAKSVRSERSKDVSVAAFSNVLVLAAGLVSFPITTRLLSSSEFGLLSFWESGLLVLVAILKLGASDAPCACTLNPAPCGRC